MIALGTPLRLRSAQPGDRFQPRGLGGRSQKLVTTLGGMGVPVYWRARVPLLVVEDARIAWLVAPSDRGLRGRVGAPFAVPPDIATPGRVLVVRWDRAAQG